VTELSVQERYQAQSIADAYRHCWQIAVSHYENFTVGSWLLPRHLRQHIAAIYAFARTADDLADEGDLEPAERLSRLEAWGGELEACYRGQATHPIFVALRHTAERFDLPIDSFRKLLRAFRADVEFTPFDTFDALLDYCRCSADPVGHLILGLFGYHDAERQQLADQICTGLQLANFWQDIAVDAAKGRLYVPREDLVRFGCSTTEIEAGTQNTALRELMKFEVERASAMLRSGLALAAIVDPRLAREVCLFAWGGLAILREIELADYDVFTRRPTLSRRAKLGLVLQALLVPAGASRHTPHRSAAAVAAPPAKLALHKKSGNQWAPFDTAAEKMRPTQAERQNTLTLHTQPLVLSSRPLSAAYRRAPAGSVCAQPAEPVTNVSSLRVLRNAYAYCQQVTRCSSSNFYYAFRLLDPERREALYAVYAFCRFVDDIADDQGRRDPASLLAEWRAELARVYAGTPTHPIGSALADSVQRFALPQSLFVELIEGVEMDLTRRRYATFDELYEYCYRVASTVGLMCIEIFGYQQPSARDYAVDLGIAFQLTNILRDVLEDSRRGRIYLPLEDVRRFDCTEAELLGGRYSPRIGALMAFECGRARAYYLRARGVLAAEDRGSLAAAEAMRSIYERLLDRLEARHFNVFGPKVTLPRYEKLTLALAAWGRCQLAVRTS
jgi:phytoene synthase